MNRHRVIVTGCSSGIGHHTALELANREYRVVATLRSDDGRAALEAAGVQVAHLDLTDEPERATASIVDSLGGLDALVANAGCGFFGCFEDLTDADLRAQMEVNFFGTAACVRAALPALRASRGRLVVLGSIAGRRAAPGSSAYNASKYALTGWSESLRHELAPFGVEVVLVEPGLTRTGFQAARRSAAHAGQGPYAAITRRLRELHGAQSDKAAPVHTSVRAIVRALELPSPPIRVVPTASAKAELLAARLLPWPVWEALVRWKLRLPTP